MGIAADFVLIVVAGLLGGVLARALRLPLLVGYVVAGVFVGPNTGGPTVAHVEDLETLAEIGVALLLFSIGLEVSFRDLQVVKRICLIGGPIQVLATVALSAVAAVMLLGFGQTDALWFGAMISVSSTMVVLKVLAAGGVFSTLASRVMIGLLLVQDLAVIPMLIVLPQLGAADASYGRVAVALAVAALVLAGVYFAGTKVLPPVFRAILGWGSRELFLVAVVATGIGIGAGVHMAGLSFALGAFVAGLILSESEFSHQALADVIPLRDIFGLLFFVTVGMLFEPAYAWRNAGWILLVVLAIIVGKALLIGWLAKAFGYRNMAPWIIGLGLAQIGEFSFVLARTGLSGGFVSKPMYDLALTSTVVTMALAPLVSSLAIPLGRWWQARFGAGAAPVNPAGPVAAAGLRDHVIVGGYGRTGRAVAMALKEAGIPFVVVEASYPVTADLRDDGHLGLWGDLSQDTILHAADVDHAKMLLLTMQELATVELAIQRARARNPKLAVVARSTKAQHLPHLRKLGAAAVQPEFEGGLEMVRQGLLHCGRGEVDVHQLINRLRREIYPHLAEIEAS